MYETLVRELIGKGKEGHYWDFKLKWSSKGDLIKDIICLANNISEHDGYLIFGIDNNLNIVGVESDTNRKNLSGITQFVSGRKFAFHSPEINLETIIIDGHEVDILIIKNTSNTPYYLKETFEGVKQGIIYSRLNDTNTGSDSYPTSDQMIEYLWKKRFGINKNVIEKLHICLNDWKNWGIYSESFGANDFIQGGDWGNKNYMMNRYFPEYRIEIDEDSYQSWECETMRCFYINQTSGHYKARIFYNNMELYTFNLAHVDEYRKYLVVPRTGMFKNDKRKNESGPRYFYPVDNMVRFYYILEDSIEGKVQKIITHGTYNTQSRGADRWWLLVFKDQDEYNEFIFYAEQNHDLYRVGIKNGENSIGDEEKGAHIPMADTHNAYRYYVEFMTKIKNVPISNFGRYLEYYDFLSAAITN